MGRVSSLGANGNNDEVIFTNKYPTSPDINDAASHNSAPSSTVFTKMMAIRMLI